MSGSRPQGRAPRQQHRSSGDGHEALVAAFRAWLVDGPNNSTLTFSKRGGSVTLEAASAHGPALDLLQRLVSSE